jgi:hypothetical protein
MPRLHASRLSSISTLELLPHDYIPSTAWSGEHGVQRLRQGYGKHARRRSDGGQVVVLRTLWSALLVGVQAECTSLGIPKEVSQTVEGDGPSRGRVRGPTCPSAACGTATDINSVNMDRAFAECSTLDPFAGNDSIPGFAGTVIMGMRRAFWLLPQLTPDLQRDSTPQVVQIVPFLLAPLSKR